MSYIYIYGAPRCYRVTIFSQTEHDLHLKNIEGSWRVSRGVKGTTMKQNTSHPPNCKPQNMALNALTDYEMLFAMFDVL